MERMQLSFESSNILETGSKTPENIVTKEKCKLLQKLLVHTLQPPYADNSVPYQFDVAAIGVIEKQSNRMDQDSILWPGRKR